MITLSPAWHPANASGSAPGPFQEVWHLKLNDPASKRALWIRFALLMSSNGFKRMAEVWVVHFQRGTEGEVRQFAVRHTHDIADFIFQKEPEGDVLRLGSCELSERGCKGSIQSKGHAVSWDLAFSPRQEARYDLVPGALKALRLVRNEAVTVQGDLLVNGTARIDGQEVGLRDASGMISHQSGKKGAHTWTWAHCNRFTTEEGDPSSFVFEGYSAQTRWAGPVPGPGFTSFFFLHQGKPYLFNSVSDSLRMRSSASLNEWKFQADRGDLSFRGEARSELKEFAGITLEDTNGSLIYTASSRLSDLSIHVYRRGKLESALLAPGTAALEFASRVKNPYIPLIL